MVDYEVPTTPKCQHQYLQTKSKQKSIHPLNSAQEFRATSWQYTQLQTLPPTYSEEQIFATPNDTFCPIESDTSAPPVQHSRSQFGFPLYEPLDYAMVQHTLVPLCRNFPSFISNLRSKALVLLHKKTFERVILLNYGSKHVVIRPEGTKIKQERKLKSDSTPKESKTNQYLPKSSIVPLTIEGHYIKERENFWLVDFKKNKIFTDYFELILEKVNLYSEEQQLRKEILVALEHTPIPIEMRETIVSSLHMNNSKIKWIECIDEPTGNQYAVGNHELALEPPNNSTDGNQTAFNTTIVNDYGWLNEFLNQNSPEH